MLLLLLLTYAATVHSARILSIFPVASYSHNMIYRQITLELHSRGHEIVVLTTNPLREKSPENNYTEIDLSFLYQNVDNREFSTAFDRNRIEVMYTFSFDIEKKAHSVFNLPEVQYLIHGNEHFDLVLLEWSAHPSYCAFAELFKCPLIGVRPMALKVEGNDAVGNPFTPSYMPLNYMHYDNDFWGRLTNTFLTIAVRVFYSQYVLPRSENMVKMYFKNHSKYIGDIEKNVSLVLVNTYPVLTGVRPLVPAVIEIGGVHLQKKIPDLPPDVKDFLDSATEGVILLSFGTVVRSWDLPEETLNIFKRAFAELPYKILWRWAPDNFPNKTSKIKLLKWLPQQAALAHPNMKLFITHGGLHSVEEALVNKVPLICIPFFADQYCNCRQVARLGVGERFDLNDITKESLKQTIQQVIHKSNYKNDAEKIGKILLDQPVPPLEKAMWWIEYVLRHKGAHHLRSESVGLPWYIYYSFDIYAFFLSLFLLLVLSSILSSKIIFHFTIPKKRRSKKKKNKENKENLKKQE